ncbi:MAG: tetratricopeptide repeat protein [Gemmatimonadetes bacterium]|nr:tetratricopeptide repeat protein [Gemmatimonadota bacterium]
MSRLRSLARFFKQGATIRVVLRNGEVRTGVLGEMDEEGIQLQLSDGTPGFYFADGIASVELVDAPPAPSDASQTVSRPSMAAASETRPHVDSGRDTVDSDKPGGAARETDSIVGGDLSSGTKEVQSPEIPERLEGVRVQSQLARGFPLIRDLLTSLPQLGCDPDWTFPQEKVPPSRLDHARKEWVRAQNMYNNAVRVRELSRLREVVSQVLRPLMQECPSVTEFAATASLLATAVGQTDLALELAHSAVLKEPSAANWRTLASVSAKWPALHCYSLRRWLLALSDSVRPELWRRYCGAAIGMRDETGLRDTYAHIVAVSEGTVDPSVTEALAYAFDSVARPDVLFAIEAALAAPAAAGSDAVRVERALHNAILVEPDALRNLNKTYQAANDRQSGPDLAAHQRISTGSEGALRQRTSAADADTDSDAAGLVTGRIDTYGSLEFGFILSPDHNRFFFRLKEVLDADVRRALRDGSWRTNPSVQFAVQKSPGQQYDRATAIIAEARSTEAMIRFASDLYQQNQSLAARRVLRTVLQREPGNDRAGKMLRQYPLAGLPKGAGPYAAAKRAQLADFDLDEAERLFRKAIQESDNRESACKDLASLLDQRGRTEQAIEVLQKARAHDKGTRAYDSMLAAYYQQTGQHDLAIKILNELRSAASRRNKAVLLRRIALSQYKLGHIKEARKALQEVLDIVPGDPIATRWLVGMDSPQSSDSGWMFDGTTFVEEGVQLSALSTAALRECRFEGLQPSKLESGDISIDDVNSLEEIARRFGTERPKDRAAYLLSAAALLNTYLPSEPRERVNDLLRRRYRSMGEAAYSDRQAGDVVRAYLLESLALAVDQSLDENWRTLVLYCNTLCEPNSQGTFRPRSYDIPDSNRKALANDFMESFRKYLGTCQLRDNQGTLLALLDVAARGPALGGPAFVDSLEKVAPFRALVARLLGDSATSTDEAIAQVWVRRVNEHRKTRAQMRADLSSWKLMHLSGDACAQLEGELRRIALKQLPLDADRSVAAAEIASRAQRYLHVLDFDDKRQHYQQIVSEQASLRDEIVGGPTEVSFELLLPIVDHLLSLLEEDFARVERDFSPQLTVDLAIDSYAVRPGGDVTLQIAVSNRQGCSAAADVSVEVSIRNADAVRGVVEESSVITSIRGGAREILHVIVRPDAVSIAEGAFAVAARLLYRDNAGSHRGEPLDFSVRLYDSAEFSPLANPYAAFSEGGAVVSTAMFKGREKVLERLQEALLSQEGRKAIVLYGQKRAGKSSLLSHLQRRLELVPHCVPVAFSVHDISTALSEASFYHRILRSIYDYFESKRASGESAPQLAVPHLAELGESPVIAFHDRMMDYMLAIHRWHNNPPRVVLLVDEFTDVYSAIRSGRIERQFMRAWKSIVEKGYFASVLVGNDTMPAFKETFPNEFGIAQEERVTYLDESGGRALVEEPVGAERYAERQCSAYSSSPRAVRTI